MKIIQAFNESIKQRINTVSSETIIADVKRFLDTYLANNFDQFLQDLAAVSDDGPKFTAFKAILDNNFAIAAREKPDEVKKLIAQVSDKPNIKIFTILQELIATEKELSSRSKEVAKILKDNQENLKTYINPDFPNVIKEAIQSYDIVSKDIFESNGSDINNPANLPLFINRLNNRYAKEAHLIDRICNIAKITINFTEVQRIVNALIEKSTTLPAADRRSLQHHLIAPVQRLSRILLLIQQALKTLKDNPDFKKQYSTLEEDLNSLQRKMLRVCASINQLQKAEEALNTSKNKGILSQLFDLFDSTFKVDADVKDYIAQTVTKCMTQSIIVSEQGSSAAQAKNELEHSFLGLMTDDLKNEGGQSPILSNADQEKFYSGLQRVQQDLERSITEEDARIAAEEARRQSELRKKAEEEARKKAEEEARKKEQEEKARKEAEERARQETERKQQEEEKRLKEEAGRKRQEEIRRKEEETRRKTEEEARKKAEEEARKKEQEEKARKEAEEHARQETERKQQEEEKRQKEETERKQEEARKKAEEEARKKAEEDARRKAEEQARKAAEEEKLRKETEERVRQENERKRQEEEKRQKEEAERKRKAEEEARRKAEEEARNRKAEEEKRQKEETERKQEEARKKAEEENRRRAEAEEARKKEREEKERQAARDQELQEENGLSSVLSQVIDKEDSRTITSLEIARKMQYDYFRRLETSPQSHNDLTLNLQARIKEMYGLIDSYNSRFNSIPDTSLKQYYEEVISAFRQAFSECATEYNASCHNEDELKKLETKIVSLIDNFTLFEKLLGQIFNITEVKNNGNEPRNITDLRLKQAADVRITEVNTNANKLINSVAVKGFYGLAFSIANFIVKSLLAIGIPVAATSTGAYLGGVVGGILGLSTVTFTGPAGLIVGASLGAWIGGAIGCAGGTAGGIYASSKATFFKPINTSLQTFAEKSIDYAQEIETARTVKAAAAA